MVNIRKIAATNAPIRKVIASCWSSISPPNVTSTSSGRSAWSMLAWMSASSACSVAPGARSAVRVWVSLAAMRVMAEGAGAGIICTMLEMGTCAPDGPATRSDDRFSRLR